MKKILCLLLVAAMTALVFTSCGENAEANVLTVATNAEFEPYEFLDSNGNVVGFDADLINAIADKLGMKVAFKNMEFEGVIAAVTSNTCQVAISGLTINAKRSQSVDFSNPYHEGVAQVLIVRTDDNVFTGTTKEQLDEQLKGKNIGVCTGFTGAAYANGDEEWGFEKIEDATVKTYENISLAINDLKSGSIDVIIMDDQVAKNAASTDNNKSDIRVIDVPLTVESYAIAIPKGDTEMKQKIDDALAELEESGELDQLKEQWEL